jgi:hypothetical protein
MAAAEAPPSSSVLERCGKDEVYLETHECDGADPMLCRRESPIIQTVVERTMGPILARAIARAENTTSRPRILQEERRPGRRIVEEVLGLKVLDPAMGSGRLLVEATHALACMLATHPRVRAAEAEEDDLSYWKRRVVERCVYGVDKDPLAVELAKLSLWLSTVAADRPLSFLDHHLVQGDALIGAQVELLGWPPPVVLRGEARRRAAQQRVAQINMFDHLLRQTLPGVIGQVLEITREESKDYDTVQAKQSAARSAQELRLPFEAVADLWVSAYFGNTFARGDYEEALGVISQPELLLALESVRRARRAGDQKGFFHWELTFPEAFYNEFGQPLGNQAGFDAVVADPPWNQTVSDEEMAFFDAVGIQLGSTADGLASLFFAERTFGLLSERGRLGLLLPDAVLDETVLDEFRCWASEFDAAGGTVDLNVAPEQEEDRRASMLLMRPGLSGATSTHQSIPAGQETSGDEREAG